MLDAAAHKLVNSPLVVFWWLLLPAAVGVTMLIFVVMPWNDRRSNMRRQQDQYDREAARLRANNTSPRKGEMQ